MITSLRLTVAEFFELGPFSGVAENSYSSSPVKLNTADPESSFLCSMVAVVVVVNAVEIVFVKEIGV